MRHLFERIRASVYCRDGLENDLRNMVMHEGGIIFRAYLVTIPPRDVTLICPHHLWPWAGRESPLRISPRIHLT